VNGILEHAARETLLALGIPSAALEGKQGLFLAAYVEDSSISVKGAAEAAGVHPDRVRQWRRRDPIFASAESAARSATPYQPPVEGEPRPAPAGPHITDLRKRLRRAIEICEHLGPGPWPGTRFARAQNAGIYRENRQLAVELIDKLRALGDQVHEVAPPPANPYPSTRGRRGNLGWGN
jgi:hypothetical protein